MAQQKRYDIFVSYSRHDEGLVKPLSAVMGIHSEVFLDVQELKAGDLWESEIVSAIQGALVFVLCWCCRSIESEFISKEVSVALERHPRNREKRIVPVL